MELLGAGYVADYCIARLLQKQEQKMFRIYVTDALMALTNSVSNRFGGTSITARFTDIIKPREEKNAAEIITDVMARAGLRFAGD